MKWCGWMVQSFQTHLLPLMMIHNFFFPEIPANIGSRTSFPRIELITQDGHSHVRKGHSVSKDTLDLPRWKAEVSILGSALGSPRPQTAIVSIRSCKGFWNISLYLLLVCTLAIWNQNSQVHGSCSLNVIKDNLIAWSNSSSSVLIPPDLSGALETVE